MRASITASPRAGPAASAPLAALPCLATVVLTLLACPVPPRLHPRAGEEVSRGYQHLAHGDPERAEVAFEHALAFDPDFPEGENGLGVVARLHGDYPQARRHFTRALSLRPDFAEAQANLGEVLLMLGDADAGEAELRSALAVNPDLGDARQNLARSLLRRGLAPGGARGDAFAAARRELLHLLEAEPDRGWAHHDLAFLDYEEGRYAEAERGYRRAAALLPSSVEALHGLCISLARVGRCGEAVDACGRCLAVKPGTSECARSLAGARTCLGQASAPRR
jgi:Flp pilus assembly protein TadD